MDIYVAPAEKFISLSTKKLFRTNYTIAKVIQTIIQIENVSRITAL